MEKLVSVYWFAILVLVAGGIFIMVYTFYHQPYDVRMVEARILSNNIADCVSQEGSLVVNLDSNLKKDFLTNCHLLLGDQDPEYYFEVNFYEFPNTINSVFEIIEGNKNYKADCEVQKKQGYENLPKCIEKRFYSVDNSGNQYLIKILSAVGKVKENAK